MAFSVHCLDSAHHQLTHQYNAAAKVSREKVCRRDDLQFISTAAAALE